MLHASNYLGSDDVEMVLEASGEEHEIAWPHDTNQAGPSNYASRKQRLKEEIGQHDAEIAKNEDEIRILQTFVNHLRGERDRKLKELEEMRPSASNLRESSGIDYTHEQYEWTRGLKAKMKKVFGIENFRLCQEGVCNANMDGRDIVCVMPTGGGKSLTYQLPAILQPGCTIVISPLISLITDQILHLQESGVQGVKLTGTTSKQETSDITQRLTALANGKLTSKDQEIKLCYVTPEKIAKSKFFVGLLQKLYDRSQLARFVIDEAHCVSQLGHDFRPDYQKLHMLRKLFPLVPIMALSATCPPKVLDDLISTLGLEKVVDGNNASARGTVYFTAPLYRKNLHYSIIPKPANGAAVLEAMANYILKHHENESGIVYCLSKKDTENVAEGLQKLSEGKIKTGVYHADRHDGEKESLHLAWRRGTIKVVCATIAFGMGIDKGDVRFVLHHSISKSLEGYYQESGRAGRDGKDSDCVLYYRPQDAMTLSSMVAGTKEGKEKLHAMLRFAQDLEQCRKTQFTKYFSSTSAWTAESDPSPQCGHCDNCTRSKDEITRKTVTYQAWQLVKIAKTLNDSDANITFNHLATLARGNAGGKYEVSRKKGGRGKNKEKEKLDLDKVAGGEVDLTKDEIERLLVDLLLSKYLAEKYSTNAYGTNIYVACGSHAPMLLEGADDLEIKSVFWTKTKKSKATGDTNTRARKLTSSKAVGKRKRIDSDSEDDDRESIEITLGDYDDDEAGDEPTAKTRVARPTTIYHGFILSDEGSEQEDVETGNDWDVYPMKKNAPLAKKARQLGLGQPLLGKLIKENDREILVLSD